MAIINSTRTACRVVAAIVGDQKMFAVDTGTEILAYTPAELTLSKEDQDSVANVPSIPYPKDSNDISIAKLCMQNYGYRWDGMLPISTRLAFHLAGNDYEVFALSQDCSETSVDADDVAEMKRESDIMFGVSVAEWMSYCGVPAMPHCSATDSEEAAELMAYRQTGLTPSEIQEAVDLFKDTNSAVPDEIKGWVNRASFHARKCVELEKTIKDLSLQVVSLQVEATERMKNALNERIHRETEEIVERVATGLKTSLFDPNNRVGGIRGASYTVALVDAIESVFKECDFQYLQCRELTNIQESFSLVDRVRDVLKKNEKVSYSTNEIKDAIYSIIPN